MPGTNPPKFTLSDINISNMSTDKIIFEIKNRLNYICAKTKFSKRKISIILNKQEHYVAHLFKRNKSLDMLIFIEIVKIFGLSLNDLLQPKSSDFINAIEEKLNALKQNTFRAFKPKEIFILQIDIKELQRKYNSKYSDKSLKKYLLTGITKKLNKIITLIETELKISKSENRIKYLKTTLYKTREKLEKIKAIEKNYKF